MPHNLDAERQLLSAMAIDNSIIPGVLERISAEDLYLDKHQVLFAAAEGLHRRGMAVDGISLMEELDSAGRFRQLGGDDFLGQVLGSAPHAVNWETHVAIVRQHSIRRRLMHGAAEIIREGSSNRLTAQELHSRASGLITSIEPESDEPWPEMSLEHEPEAPCFPADVFPAGLACFCRGVAAATLAPEDVAGVAMLAVASAAIGQSVNIYLKRTWHESPLLYALIVAEPGKSKTPPMKLVVKPLTQVDGELRKDSRLERSEWEESRRGSKGAPRSDEPPQRRAVVKDITRETLVAILADNPRGVLADPDEATGWVGSFNEYKGKGTDRQFWLDLWSSRAISVDREGGRRSSWVSSPFVTVLGGIPPEMLGSLSEERGRNDGFHDRLLFTYPSSFPKQAWFDDELDANAENAWIAVIRKLHKAAMHFDADRNLLRPHVVGFAPRALDLWRDWYNGHCAQMEEEDAPAWVPGAYSKLRAYCARFALILSRLRLALDPDLAVGDVRSPVSEDDLFGAITLVDYFKGHLARIQHRATGGTGNRDAQVILGWIRRRQVETFREAAIREDLRRRFPDLPSLAPALRALMDAGAIRLKRDSSSPGKRGPKPSRTFEVNPALQVPLGAPEITDNTVNSPEKPF